MTKPILFYAQQCPDTAPFVAELKRLNIAYEAVEVLSNLANFKHFLRLRDTQAVFDQAKQQGYAGLPALLLADNRVILEYSELVSIKAI